ncbi:PucR family transcriptional regulator [Lentzea sp. NBRC 105346]|uniref:PucR family transcriptional regulator n=1 Tax=Lentzea sp. NBRC 105346 TaxID=3032205 RepID=UPI0024A4D24E|nr:PucR family transcriptional regulator [Lentzea sp. NBRC 105346]GLZ33645.1 PucR family transcriptional regulator [Lentzea sp. NBRC 105346]
MPLTIGELARDLRLRVLAGDTDRRVGWVHGTELADPTPFLEGGELLLTTGLTLTDFESYVDRLVRAGVVGLGFGTGLSHDTVPPELIRAAEKQNLALLEVPRKVPFIAISKAVSRAVAKDEYAALTRTSEAQRALTRAAVRTDGVAATVRRLGQWIDGWVMLLDAHGTVVHGFSRGPDISREIVRLKAAGGLASAAFEIDGQHVFLQLLGAKARGFLAVGTPDALDAADRSIVNTAASLLALALAQSDAVDAAQRELRAAQFRLMRNGLHPAPPGPFRVFLTARPPEDDVFWAEVDGQIVVLANDLDDYTAASSPTHDVEQGYLEAQRAQHAGVRRFEDSVMSFVPDGFAEALLRPLDETSREALRVWLAHHGQWDPAATRLGVHRHTLKNRIRRAEEQLGRSLDSPGVRAELWLALNAR